MVFMAINHFSGSQGQTTTSDLSRPPPADCPRCGSTNTKFCYYNNYNKSQPRYFCKSCKRHWTKGGALRSIPAGRRRRNKRHRPSISAAAAAAVLLRREQTLPDPFSLSADVQNDMSDILYRALVGSSAVECIDTGVPQCTILESHGAAYAPRNQSTEFTFSTTFNYQFSSENLDSTEESTVTTSTAPPQASAVNPAAELWNWNNEFDFLGSSADTYTLWDDFRY